MLLQIELVGRKKEVIAINVYQVLLIASKNENHTVVFDSTGMEHLVNEPYEQLLSRFNSLIKN
ncbi:MAG: hypothetical protein IKA90_04890 [Clostridia bacterium]|nr:hypothetical protein [Clostridia bacterium]